jgi:hypothetical protein
MAMGRAVVVTNFSGPTEFLTQANSYPLPVQAVDAKGFAGDTTSLSLSCVIY